MGGARRRGDFRADARRRPRGDRRRGGGPRRHRDHQPARDGGGVGPGDGPPSGAGDRLAGPADRRSLRRDHAGHGPGRGRLLLGQQAGVAAARRPGSRGPRGLRRPRGRDDRQLVDLEAHEWRGPCHRPDERVADDVVRHQYPRVERATLRPVWGPPGTPAGGASIVGRLRRRARRSLRGIHPHRQRGGRPAVGALRPGVLDVG
jgi:hypothetical protein